MRLSKTFEFQAAHRIPNHKEKCKNIHGHNYEVKLVFEGKEIEKEGYSSSGMLIDFGDVKKLVKNLIDEIDHSYIAYAQDKEIIDFFNKQGFKLYILDKEPTAENIAKEFFHKVSDALQKHTPNLNDDVFSEDIVLKQVTVSESKNSSVTYEQ